MPQDTVNDRVPAEALDAFLEGVLADLKTPTDPETLNAVRASFRKRIPFHLRSYAAALLILRAAGLARPAQGSGAPGALKAATQAERPARPRDAAPARDAPPARTPRAGKKTQAPAPEARADRADRPDRGPVTPLFVSAGKRQRLKPGELRAMISEKTGIPADTLGRVRLFDNYCFIDVPEANAHGIIEAMHGAEFQGKPLEINIAKKRGEGASAEE